MDRVQLIVVLSLRGGVGSIYTPSIPIKKVILDKVWVKH